MRRLGTSKAQGFRLGAWGPLPGWGLLYVNPQKVLEFPSLAGCPLQLLLLQCSALLQRLPPPIRVFTLREKEAALDTSLPLNREKEAITSMHTRKQPEDCLGL